MFKQDSVVKLSNLVVPRAEKERKAGDGYVKSYRAMPVYSRKRIDALFD